MLPGLSVGIKELNILPEQLSDTYLIADTHFDHKNIIRYCHRPFRDVRQMNDMIVRNWRLNINGISIVLFLGDMSYSRYARPVKWWLSRLPGQILYIPGNHELGRISGYNLIDVKREIILNAGGMSFYITHDPANIPFDWEGWAIHGHKHDTVPFIDWGNKRVCVSVELINYVPFNLARLIEILSELR